MSVNNDRVCTLEINTDMTYIVCSKCGWQVPHGSNPNDVHECPECKRLVAHGTPSLYIIGPATRKPNDNKEAFVSARRALKAEGYLCAIPHDYINEGTDWSTAMRISVTAMLSMEHGIKSKPAFDGVAMLDGWEESKGARIEKQLAEALGIPCRPWREYLNPAAPAASMAATSAAQPLLALASQ